ncbi:MAG: hypothetical protein Q9191_002148 [Dirinaria sp. TL-2023a]
MATPTSLPARIRGSIFGVAVTDALGGPVEFSKRGSFPPVTDFKYNSNFDLAPGTWTDDTSLTLCLAQSLVDTGGVFNAEDQIKKYIRWYDQGYMSANGECFDIGNATRIALETWKEHLENPGGLMRGQAAIDASLKHKVQCGNGSLMRVSPIALVYHQDTAVAVENAVLASQLTHPYVTNSEACKVYTQLLVLTLSGASKEVLASTLGSYGFEDLDLRHCFAKYEDLTSFTQVPETEIHSSGYVVHSLEASLWAFFTTNTFREGALKVVNLGDDADTVGAIYGGLAGAFYGAESIPSEWLKGLKKKDVVEEVIKGVINLVTKEA